MTTDKGEVTMGLFTRPSSTTRFDDLPFIDNPDWRDNQESKYNIDIVGESFYKANILRAVAANKKDSWTYHTEHGQTVYYGCVAAVVAEPDNPHDENAVAVYISGLKVGHIARGQNQALLEEFARGGVTGVRVRAMIGTYSSGAHPNVRLSMPVE